MTADGFFAHIWWSGGQMLGSASLSATTSSGTMLFYLYWSVCAENMEQLLISLMCYRGHGHGVTDQE